MRGSRTALLTLGLALCAVARAEPEPEAAAVAAVTWEHQGYASLLAAAAEAQTHGKRLLLGLSGSPT